MGSFGTRLGVSMNWWSIVSLFKVPQSESKTESMILEGESALPGVRLQLVTAETNVSPRYRNTVSIGRGLLTHTQLQSSPCQVQ